MTSSTMTRAEAIRAVTGPGEPYELVDGVAGGRRTRLFRNAPRSLRALFEATATDRPFLVHGDERLTYAQAWAAASRIGHVLVHDCGVRPGDRVAISMRNHLEWMLAFNATVSIGAIAVAMNAHWQAEEMAFGLRDCEARVLLADTERLERLARCGPLPGLTVLAVRAAGLAPGVRALSALTEAVSEVPMPAADIDPDDAATILYTSGSTGHPKGVVSTHRNILSALLSWELDRLVGERVAGIEAGGDPSVQGTLLAVPLFHVTGLAASYLASFRLQRRLVAMHRWDPEVAAALIERERLTSLVGPAAVTGDLLRIAAEGRHELGTLLSLGGGGAPRAPEQVRRIDATLANAMPITGWGMTETFAIGAGIGGEDYLTRPESSGRSALVLDLRVVDEQGMPLPAGGRGELQVRGASLFRGYWRRPEVDAEVFADGGWFRTGDMAYLDDEGFVFIVDRIKDLIIRGGENIGCGQVEAALLQHPEVHEAAVYAVPDERLGEEVGATVYCEATLEVEALRAFLAERLAGFEVPRYIVRSAEPLPRTPSGKILKRRIRDAALGRGAG